MIAATHATTPHRPLLTPPRLALIAATLLVGLSAGFFYTYETSVTLGLAQVDDITYVTTFQAINATIRNAGFAIAFFGPVPVLAIALGLNRRSRRVGLLTAVALVLYVGGMVVTFAGNVPLNNELATYTSLTPEIAATARENFEAPWNRLNLIRTIAIVASFLSLLVTSTTPSEERPSVA